LLELSTIPVGSLRDEKITVLDLKDLGADEGFIIASLLKVTFFRSHRALYNTECDFLDLLQFLLCAGEQESHKPQLAK
jgi:hypothetical protein